VVAAQISPAVALLPGERLRGGRELSAAQSGLQGEGGGSDLLEDSKWRVTVIMMVPLMIEGDDTKRRMREGGERR
jgi:hypothetical protein